MERSGQDLAERSVSCELIVASLLVDLRRKDQPANHELTEDLTGLDRLPAEEATPVVESLRERAAQPFDVEIAQPPRPSMMASSSASRWRRPSRSLIAVTMACSCPPATRASVSPPARR